MSKIDFTTIREHIIDPPNTWTYFGDKEDFAALSDEFKDQLFFLDKEARDFLYRYFEASSFHTGPMWEPFAKQNFKYTEQISVDSDLISIKKWLYNRGIPFSTWVFMLPGFSGHPMMMTWKMVVKHCDDLFFGNDLIFFDETNQWCLTYWHEDELFFGKINTSDPEIGYQRVAALNELEKKFPGFKHPLK